MTQPQVMGSKRFGKNRALGCTCTESFTCRACLNAAALPHFTPSTVSEQVARDEKPAKE